MTTVANGSTVTFHYKGTLNDGTEFDSSHKRNEPMTAITGQGNLIPGFETALLGMTEGETKAFTLEATDAYGERNDEAMTTMPREAFPEDFVFEDGMTIPLMGPGGSQVIATLLEHSDKEVKCDLNHPLAGQALTFELELLTVEGAE